MIQSTLVERATFAVLQQVLMNSLQTPGIGATTGFSSLRSYVSSIPVFLPSLGRLGCLARIPMYELFEGEGKGAEDCRAALEAANWVIADARQSLAQ